MKFVKTHLASVIIIALLIIGCLILNKRNKELKEELNTVNEELQISLQRSSSLIIKFKIDFRQYDLLLRKLMSDFKYYTEQHYQMKLTVQGRYLSNEIVFKSLMNLRNQLKGFEYMLNFPEYYKTQSLFAHFSKIRKIQSDLAHLIIEDADNIIGNDSYIWGQDTLINVKFQELKNESDKFYAAVDSIN